MAITRSSRSSPSGPFRAISPPRRDWRFSTKSVSVSSTTGGSATTDGGRGAVEAIAAEGGLRGSRLTVLCDVETPFEEAARVFAPQKGASAEQVELLAERLDEYASTLPRDPRGRPMTGCAGGLSGGLWAAFGAELAFHDFEEMIA